MDNEKPGISDAFKTPEFQKANARAQKRQAKAPRAVKVSIPSKGIDRADKWSNEYTRTYFNTLCTMHGVPSWFPASGIAPSGQDRILSRFLAAIEDRLELDRKEAIVFVKKLIENWDQYSVLFPRAGEIGFNAPYLTKAVDSLITFRARVLRVEPMVKDALAEVKPDALAFILEQQVKPTPAPKNLEKSTSNSMSVLDYIKQHKLSP